jgi:TatD DNase family protein
MEFVDTHCHIHEVVAGNDGLVHSKWLQAGVRDADVLIDEANRAGVTGLVCVGTSLEDSELAVDFVRGRPGAWAAIGLHPHEAKHYAGKKDLLKRFSLLAKEQKVVAVGECGLDYYYTHSPQQDQKELLRFQIELAVQHDLPLIFHIRDAFDDFWPIFDDYKGLRGIIHSFSATTKELDEILARGLYVGLNGIMTFTKNVSQITAAKQIPLDHLVLETDAPFLTPTPYRGTICRPSHVRVTAEFLANLRGESLIVIASTTTHNARRVFNLY